MTQGVSEKDTYIYRFIVFFPPGRMKNMHKVYIKWGGTGYKSFTVVQDAGARWMDVLPFRRRRKLSKLSIVQRDPLPPNVPLYERNR